MRTRFFKLGEEERKELDREQNNDKAEENLQQQMWQQNHVAIIESKKLGGEVELEIQ